MSSAIWFRAMLKSVMRCAINKAVDDLRFDGLYRADGPL
jgi:hypothetical protein